MYVSPDLVDEDKEPMLYCKFFFCRFRKGMSSGFTLDALKETFIKILYATSTV